MIIRLLAQGELCKANGALSLFSDGNFTYGEKLPEFSWRYNKFPYGIFIQGKTKKEVLKRWAETLGEELEAEELLWRQEPVEIGKLNGKVFSQGVAYYLKKEVLSIPKVISGEETVGSRQYGRKVKL